jgi:hypothetical protein
MTFHCKVNFQRNSTCWLHAFSHDGNSFQWQLALLFLLSVAMRAAAGRLVDMLEQSNVNMILLEDLHYPVMDGTGEAPTSSTQQPCSHCKKLSFN